MHVLIAIALKSVLIAGLALGLLALMTRRSAAERSWVAHIGLLALVIMALAPLVLPKWNVEAPALLGRVPTVEATVQDSPPMTIVASTPVAAAKKAEAATGAPVATAPSTLPSLTAAAAGTSLYAVPAAILLFITALAIFRLIALRARAEVLVDGHWLSALARAQRRMSFKHGTALLISNELSSPISWGLVRPVILLNDRAVEASGEAEAILAHELAHVARMDWIKLLLARFATALFWFNPLVWLLAREAHQLREEAADDAVLAADIVDTDYAQLLVGVARHECPALLLGAHGVAPSRNSLARRVARVLDGNSARGPVARTFAVGVFAGAVLVAAPLAALTLTPATTPNRAHAQRSPTAAKRLSFATNDTPTDLPHIIAAGVSNSMSTVAAVVAPDAIEAAKTARAAAARDEEAGARAVEIAQERRDAARDAIADAQQAREDALADARDAIQEAHKAVHVQIMSNGPMDAIIAMKAADVEPGYVYALRTAQPRLRELDPASFAGMKSIGVTPQYARELAAAGLRNLDSNQLVAAKAVGLSGDYVRSLAAAGVPLRFDDLVQLRTVGVPVRYITTIRSKGHRIGDANTIVRMWAVGVGPDNLKAPPAPPVPPRPPQPAPPNDGSDPDGS